MIATTAYAKGRYQTRPTTTNALMPPHGRTPWRDSNCSVTASTTSEMRAGARLSISSLSGVPWQKATAMSWAAATEVNSTDRKKLRRIRPKTPVP